MRSKLWMNVQVECPAGRPGGGQPKGGGARKVVSVGEGPETRRPGDESGDEGEFIAEEPLEERFKGPQNENA